MYLSEIATLLKSQLKGDDREIVSFSINTRELLPEQLFFALKGAQFDGHEFLPIACEKKAAGAIISQPIKLPIPTIQVNDTRHALGLVANHHRSKFNLPIIAVTGSCGKTTTKNLIASILSEMGPTLAPEKSFNNDIGVPLTLLQLHAKHNYAVIEMGANHPQEIAYLSKITQQTVSLITNVAPAHLEGFGSIEGVAKTKGEIYESLPINGMAVLNADDSFFSYWQQKIKANMITFGMTKPAEVTARNIAMDVEGRPSFELSYPGGVIQIQLPLLGRHNVMNALAAVAATYAVGASVEAIKKGLSQAMPGTKRLVRCLGLNGACIIDDSYNANPLSVTAALEMLAHTKGEKIFVFGDMAELGDQAERFHQEIGEIAKQLGIDKLFTCGKLSHLTAAAFGSQGKHFQCQSSLIEILKKLLHSNAVVLVKGSRSSQMETIVEAIREN